MIKINTRPYPLCLNNSVMASRKIFITLAVVLFLGTPVIADFNDGLTAYYSGDYKKALREWRPLAKQGNANAQYRLGKMFLAGEGVRQNDNKAFKWTRKAAEQGHYNAMYSLSLMYAAGMGVARDNTEGEKWLRKAVKQELATPGPEPDIAFVAETRVELGGASKTDKVKIRLPWEISIGRIVPIEVTTLSGVTSLQLLSNRHETPIATFEFGPDAVPYVSTRFRIGAPGTIYGLAKTSTWAFYSTAEITTASEFVHGELNLPGCKSSEGRIRAKRKGEQIIVKILMGHCMNLDNYIHRLHISSDGEMMVDALLSPGISRNPFFAFKFKSPKAVKYKLEWEDTSGTSRTKTFKVH
jgi:predicted secreted protein